MRNTLWLSLGGTILSLACSPLPQHSKCSACLSHERCDPQAEWCVVDASPTLSLDAVTGVVSTERYTLTGLAQDDVGIVRTEFSLDNGSSWQLALPQSSNLRVEIPVPLRDLSRLEMAVRVFDIKEQSAVAQTSFGVDRLGPKLQLSMPRTVVGGPEVRLLLTAADGSGVSTAGATLAGVTRSSNSADGGFEMQMPLPPNQDGQLALQLLGTDGVGNKSQITTMIAIDTIAPTFSLVEPSIVIGKTPKLVRFRSNKSVTYVEAHWQQKSVTVTANGSGEYSVTLEASSGSKASLEISGTDALGNEGKTTLDLMLDTAGPSFELVNAGVTIAYDPTPVRFLSRQSVSGVSAKWLGAAVVTTSVDGGLFEVSLSADGGSEGSLEVTGTTTAGTSGTAVFHLPIDAGVLFEFAPTSGAGMGSACACAPVTGAKGEPMTLKRASTAICSKKGEAMTGIAWGDLVECPANMPRVEPDSNGTLGVRIENSATPPTLRTHELDSAPWVNGYAPTATEAPVLNAANVQAPDGTMRAEDFTFGGAGWSGGARFSSRVQANACPKDTLATGSVYVLSISGGTTFDVNIESGGGWSSTACAISTTTWTRCAHTAVTSGTYQFSIGVGQLATSTARNTTRVRVFQAQCESGSKPTSAIFAGAAPGTRMIDDLTITAPARIPLVPSSWAASVTGSRVISELGSLGAQQFWVGLDQARIDYVRGWCNANSMVEADRGTPTIAGVGGACVSTGRYAARYVMNGATASVQVCRNGACGQPVTGNSSTAPTATTVRFGSNDVQGYAIDGIISRVCIDNDPSRCL